MIDAMGLENREKAETCIVFAGEFRHMVMVSVYTDYLRRNHIPYDMILLDKYHQEENTHAVRTYRYEYNAGTKCGKIKGYLGYVHYASKILKHNKYKFLVVWNELTAALLEHVLVSSYSQRYCVNIRDVFVNKRRILCLPQNRAIRHSAFTTVSSEKYLEELPKDFSHYIFFHSFNDSFMQETAKILAEKAKQDSVLAEEHSKPIRILFIGNIRFLEHLYEFIDRIADDERYELTVAGAGSEPVREYISDRNIGNVRVFGGFTTGKTANFLAEADVIYNLYGTEDINLRYALSNKLYYAICLNLPILVYKNTYMYEVSHKCGIGFPVDESADFTADFYKWYIHLDRDKIKRDCDALINEAKTSQKKLLEEFSQYI